MSQRVGVLAPAKVNLVLRVLGRRPDGYHEIDTLFQAIDLGDEIEVELGGEGVRLEVDGPDLGPERDNLAHRAATRLLAEAAPGTGAWIRLTKRVPVGAGLGGGSSDAAGVLRCLAEVLDLGLGDSALPGIGAQLGSDVPFFLGGSTLARGRGRGELLEPLATLDPADLVLVTPPVHVATGPAYAALAAVRAGSVDATPEEPWNPGTWGEVEAMAVNDFEPVIAPAHPEIGRSLSALGSAGASLVLMSGSGSACFGRFPDGSSARRAAGALEDRLGWPCHAVRTLASFPRVRPL